MKKLLVILLAAATIEAAPPGFVVNNGSATVTVVDLGLRTVLGHINVGASPRELLILPGNRTGFITEADGIVRRLDLKQRVSVATIPVGTAPGSLTATPDGRFLYVANEGSNDVSVVDVGGNVEIKRIPVGVTPVQVNMRPDGKFVYAVNQDSASISVIDTATNTVINTVAVGNRPNQFAIDPPQRRAYIPNTASNSLTIFDLTTNTVVSTLALPGASPVVVNFSANGQTIFVVMNGSASINVVTLVGVPRVSRTIAVGAQPTDLAVTFDGLYGYAACSGASQVWVIDFAAGSGDPVSVGAQPFAVQFDPDENVVFVVETGAGRVSVIDTNTDRILGSMAVGTAPIGLAQLNPPIIPAGSIVNGASFAAGAPVSPGSIASLFGLGLAVADLDGLLTRGPGESGGTQVRVGGVAAPLYAVHDSQINFQVPTSLTGSSATLEVVSPNGSETTTISLAAVAPGVFSFSSDGKGPGAILHANFTPVTDQNPASAGEVVLIYLTGLGATTPPVADGVLAPTAPAVVRPTVTIGGRTATVDYAGTAPGFAGLYQINAAVPAGTPAGNQSVIVTGANTVTIAVR